MLLQLLLHLCIGSVIIVASVIAEEDHRFGVDKSKAEIFCQDQGVEILTAACGKILTRVMRNGVADIIQLARNIKIETQIADDAVITLADLLEIFGNVLMIAHHGIAMVKHIRHLYVPRETLTGSRCHYKTAIGISLYDFGNLSKLLGIRQRRTSEFYNLHVQYILSRRFFRPSRSKKAIY